MTDDKELDLDGITITYEKEELHVIGDCFYDSAIKNLQKKKQQY